MKNVKKIIIITVFFICGISEASYEACSGFSPEYLKEAAAKTLALHTRLGIAKQSVPHGDGVRDIIPVLRAMIVKNENTIEGVSAELSLQYFTGGYQDSVSVPFQDFIETINSITDERVETAIMDFRTQQAAVQPETNTSHDSQPIDFASTEMFYGGIRRTIIPGLRGMIYGGNATVHGVTLELQLKYNVNDQQCQRDVDFKDFTETIYSIVDDEVARALKFQTEHASV